MWLEKCKWNGKSGSRKVKVVLDGWKWKQNSECGIVIVDLEECNWYTVNVEMKQYKWKWKWNYIIIIIKLINVLFSQKWKILPNFLVIINILIVHQYKSNKLVKKKQIDKYKVCQRMYACVCVCVCEFVSRLNAFLVRAGNDHWLL